MLRDDEHRLRHIRKAAEDALAFVNQRSRTDLDGDRILARALVNCVQEIGEAAANLSPGFRSAASQVPWRSIVGMRNRLVHGYFDISLDRVWDTVTDDLPALLAALDAIGEADEKDA